MSERLNPTENRVVLAIRPVPEKTLAGIVIPADAKGRPDRAIVAAVGPGTYFGGTFVPTKLHVGDEVVFLHHAGTKVEVPVNSDKYVLVIRETDIIAVIEHEDFDIPSMPPIPPQFTC